MRVLVAPDSFTGTLPASAAASAISAGWHRRSPGDVLDPAPLSDGGPGFVDAIDAARGRASVPVLVPGPLGGQVPARVVLAAGPDGGTDAYVESAQAVGLHLVPRAERDPMRASSAGMGELLLAAVRALEGQPRPARIIVGLGGTGVCDAGAGLLTALGVEGAGERDHVDLAPARAALEGVSLVAASDVDVPLLGPRGAARGFGAQKFPDPERVLAVELDDLERVHAALAAAVGRGPDGRDPAVALGAGAAGGIGYALLALGAVRVPGIDTVLDAVRLDARIAAAEVVVTGEGSLDWQSLRGKVVSGVAARALAVGRPVVVVAGRVDVGRRELTAAGISAAFSAAEQAGSAEAAMAEPERWLAEAAARAAGTWGGA